MKKYMITNGDENSQTLLFFPESKVRFTNKKRFLKKKLKKKRNAKTYSECIEKNSERINYENTRFPSGGIGYNILCKIIKMK